MLNLIKSDFYKLVRSKVFWVSNILLFALTFVLTISLPLLIKWSNSMATDPKNKVAEQKTADIGGIIGVPFQTLFVIFVFMTIVSFAYSDIAGGYIKNIAGQVPNKGLTVVSKYIVSGVIGLVFMIVTVAANLIASAIVFELVVETSIPRAFAVFGVKWLLMMGVSAILICVAMGLSQKMLASVIGVILGTGASALIYTAVASGLALAFKTDIDLTDYSPSLLMTSGLSISILRSAIVGVVFAAGFITLAVVLFNKRDVK